MDKPTYEELEEQNSFLIEKVKSLSNQLSQVSNLNNTLHWMFKVVENKDVFENKEFINKVASKLEEILTPPEDDLRGDKAEV